jgi:hypothetical protein
LKAEVGTSVKVSVAGLDLSKPGWPRALVKICERVMSTYIRPLCSVPRSLKKGE